MKEQVELKPNYGPVYAAAVYPSLAPIFHSHGYALAVHGSLARDFDLIAVPWAERVSAPWTIVEQLIGAFAIRLIREPTPKFHGRTAFMLSIGHGECAVDLSFVSATLTAERDAAWAEVARLEDLIVAFAEDGIEGILAEGRAIEERRKA